MPLAPGSYLGPYEILDAIGAGGMGEVYRARDVRLARDVAIKVLPPIFSRDREYVRRFEQEARAAGTLNHPNIVAVYDIGMQDGLLYLVTELLEGGTLRERLSEGPLPHRQALDCAQQAARGLAAAHDKGITHRDLKPENLFLTHDGNVKILDFGLAKMPKPSGDSPYSYFQTKADVVLGTVGYMSPEQARGQPVDARSDIFSLGVVLYEMISGHRAFEARTDVETMVLIMREDPPPLPLTPPALGQLIHRCIEKLPEERFQSARDLGLAIQSLSVVNTSDSSLDTVEAAAMLAPRWSTRLPRERVAWIVAFVMAVVAALAIWAPWRKSLGIEPVRRSAPRSSMDSGAKVVPPPSPVLTARASDPVILGWMTGTPPPPGKTILFADGSSSRFPQTRWAFSNIRQLVPTRVVPRGSVATELPKSERADIDALTFHPLGSSETMTWAQSLDANYTDGILVLHRGRIVYERYFGVLTPEKQHIAFSVTKSFVGTIAASLIAEGALDDRATVARYVPELKDSGFGDATIRQLLDMTTGLKYSEEYTDEHSPVWEFSRANGFLPRPPGYQGPETSYAYLQTVGKEYPHGERFSYKTVNTDALAWVVSRVTGKSLSELVRERFWSRLGVEQDAYFTVDSVGTEFAGGGLNLALRDLARFGEMMRLGGRANGQQLVPVAVIDDIRGGGNRELFAKAGYKTLPGWSYRNMWWVSHNSHHAFSARGVHGQAIYIDPAAEMVIARFASHPMAANANFDPTSLPAYEAVAAFLMGKN